MFCLPAIRDYSRTFEWVKLIEYSNDVYQKSIGFLNSSACQIDENNENVNNI